ncbi:helix-turn-helix transcriptional regulator [Vibrio sp. SCSIO 43140]|uniref:LuxR C-terminal-related transcriptional regulator n=1 Tax=Vibrio sp. SCSIO 43140 TaxID=2819100 RepID=UPI0020761508|nr:LuxR C-terminal-related transcriptional regulator [Vibrio sp. SCSIO 43140]USD62699.1 helix-turn-helix transcriptional regulator [Vibrio sp. SCSIO 43140]
MPNDKDANTKQAILLAGNSLQSSLLKESLEQKVPLNIRLIAPEQLYQQRQQALSHELDYVIIDYAAIGKGNIERYLEIVEGTEQYTKEVLLNAPKSLAHADMLKWQNLVGVFYDTDTIETLANGFERIIDGELWMSRKLVYEYVHFYRRRQCAKTSPYYTKLTKREQQIIKLLGDGASNTEIADALFVSENTVKAHLHNAFKKIKVKNRLQALLWVKNNVATSEFVP